MAEAVIVSTAGTPIGMAHRGYINLTKGDDMASHAIRAALERARTEAGAVEEHPRLRQLLVVGRHVGEQLVLGHDARLGFLRGLDDDHESHGVS